MDAGRPRALTIGFALLVLLSLFNLVRFPTPGGEEGPPTFIIWGSIVLGILGMDAAFGIWRRFRWGLMLAVVVLVLSILAAAPGVAFAPNIGLKAASFAGVVVGVIALVLLLHPASRAALAT